MSSRTAPLWPGLALALAVLAWVGVTQVVTHVPDYDDAYNASVAKNIAAGAGYVSSFDSLIPFNPEVTTGPTLLVPAALLVRVFGTAYWVPALATLLVCMLLFVALAIVWSKQLDGDAILERNVRSAVYVGVTLLFLALAWTPEVRRLSLLGEFPAALFVCVGATALFLGRGDRVTLGVGGGVLGLAILTKTVALILVAPIVAVWAVFHSTSESTLPLKRKVVPALSVAGAIAAPTLLFELYKLLCVGAAAFGRLKGREASFFRGSGSGIREARRSPDLLEFVASNFRTNLRTLQAELGGEWQFYFYLAAFACALLGLGWKLVSRRKLGGLDHLALALLVAVAAGFSWWLGFSARGWYRHVSPVAVVASFALAASAAALLRQFAPAALALATVAWVLVTPFRWSTLLEVPRVPTAEVDALRATSAYLVQLRADGHTLMGCGWWANRRLEYVMPEPFNFRQCYAGPFEKAVLVIDRQFWDWEKSEKTKSVETDCSLKLFERYPYEVFDCPKRQRELEQVRRVRSPER
jgi:hypothetical protein